MVFHELLGVGAVIILGILGGKISHRLGIPKVTGYMLVGLIFGPSVLGLLSEQTLEGIHFLNDVALGLILFAIGGEVEWNHLRAMGRKVVFIALAESGGAFILVALVTYALTGRPGVAILLGSIAIATAPGVTLLVIREYNAHGEMTDTMLAVVALNNILGLIVFRLFFAFYSLVSGEPLMAIGFMLFKELVLSILIGAVVAALITYWEQKIDDLSELLLVIIGGLLMAIGSAKMVGISHLMICLVIGAVTNHLSMMHRLVYAELRQTEMPFYIAFFVLSGASLHLDALWKLGLLGIAYVVIRPLGKTLGVWWAGKKFGASEVIYKNLGMALIPQAGVAIGMVLTVRDSHPELGMILGTVVLSSVIVYEALGPFMTRMALARAGEIPKEEY